MNYNLKFVPFDSKRPHAGVGMAGNLLIISNELLRLKDNDMVRVDMGQYKTICSEKPHNNENAWEYYFEQTLKFTDSVDVILKPPRPRILIYDKYYSQNDKIMLEAKRLFYKHFSFKDVILNDVNNFYNENIKGKVTLGCQIRLGDMLNNNVVNVNKYWDKIKLILKEKPYIEQIFIASDDNKSIDFLKDKSNIPILHLNDIYRTSSLDPTYRLKNERKNHEYNLCKEVLVDILLLTKCDYFLRSQVSSVSLMSTLLSENIKQIYTV